MGRWRWVPLLWMAGVVPVRSGRAASVPADAPAQPDDGQPVDSDDVPAPMEQPPSATSGRLQHEPVRQRLRPDPGGGILARRWPGRPTGVAPPDGGTSGKASDTGAGPSGAGSAVWPPPRADGTAVTGNDRTPHRPGGGVPSTVAERVDNPCRRPHRWPPRSGSRGTGDLRG